MSDKKIKSTISAVILAKNEELMLETCLKTLQWCDKILVLDNGSTDKTIEIAEDLGAKVVSFAHPSFARKRNEALKYIKTDWVFYVDADERVSPTLAKEILVHLETNNVAALRMKRTNICYGYEFKHGGWNKDQVARVFNVAKFKKWFGEIHESPEFEGKVKDLKSSLLHLTHRNTEDNLRKSADWTKIEAELLFKAGAKPVKLGTLFRKGLMEFFRRAVLKRGRKDGMAGLVEAVVQGMNRIMVYIQVWELQQRPGLKERYRAHEDSILNAWQKNKIEK